MLTGTLKQGRLQREAARRSKFDVG